MDTMTIRLETKVGTFEVKAHPIDFAEVRLWLARFEKGAAVLLGRDGGQKSNEPAVVTRFIDGSLKPVS